MRCEEEERMGLYIDSKQMIRAKIILALVAAFVLVAIPTFVGFKSSLNVRAAGTPPIFVNSPRYVHANTPENTHDIAAEIEFYPGTTQVHLAVDNVPVPPQDVSDPGTQPLSTGSNRIQVRMPFAPGAHTITGTAVVDGQEVPIRGSNGDDFGVAVIYALDTPSANYEVPVPSKRSFNSTTSPVQVKIDDEFKQFKSLAFSLYTGEPGDADSQKLGDFTLTREDCNTQIEGFVVCDIAGASNWKELTEGTYFVKLKTSTKAEDGQHPDGISAEDSASWSLPFTVDTTPPGATINGPLSVTGGETIKVQGTIDKSASEGTLYVDDDAMGPAVISDDGSWTYDLKANLSLGDHKIKILAKDPADNTNIATIETATTILTVNPFIPAPADVQKVNDAAVGLTTPFAVPESLTKEDIPPAPTSNTNADTAVLGAEDAKDSKTDRSNVIAAVAPSAEGWKLFGIAWFWWVILGVILVIVGSWALASRRQYATENI